MDHADEQTASTTIALPDLNEQPFRFMDMARELRDMVYSNLYQHSEIQPIANPRFNVRNAPFPGLFRVGHEFSSEYERLAWKRAVLIYADEGSLLPNHAELIPGMQEISALFVASLKFIDRAKITFAIWCSDQYPRSRTFEGRRRSCPMGAILERNRSWIQCLACSNIEIEIMVEDMPHSTNWPKTVPHTLQPSLRRLTDLPKVRRVQMTRTHGFHGILLVVMGIIHSSRMTAGFATWTEKEGWKAAAPVEDLKEDSTLEGDSSLPELGEILL